VKYSVITFGCRVNQADSMRIEEDLRARGAAEGTLSDADLVIVNTCSVTASADQGARQAVRRVARENPRARIVVTGCYATRAPDDVAALPGVTRIVPNDDKLRTIPLMEAEGALTTAERFAGGEGACGGPIGPGIAGRTAFTLRVQTGCDERCSYCIIPATRGRGRSVPPGDVLREVRRIAAAGFREIALTGVHLGSYGRDLEPPVSLLDLLRQLAQVEEDVTFRLSSLEPMDCSPALVELVAGSAGRFAPHFHLPLQHASDAMLRRMRRPYTLDDYRDLAERIVMLLPHASIGSDLIAGFPGETEEDFACNLAYLPGSPLSHLHVFPYSDRPGTESARMPGKVDGATVRARGARLRAIGAQLSRRFLDAQTGTIRPGLTLEDGATVLTDNYVKVRIAGGRRRNERVRVRLDGHGCGTVVEGSSESGS
jgi:threonylcarbamoyladenosine tRNA methylthiotransferase MtaB